MSTYLSEEIGLSYNANKGVVYVDRGGLRAFIGSPNYSDPKELAGWYQGDPTTLIKIATRGMNVGGVTNPDPQALIDAYNAGRARDEAQAAADARFMTYVQAIPLVGQAAGLILKAGGFAQGSDVSPQDMCNAAQAGQFDVSPTGDPGSFEHYFTSLTAPIDNKAMRAWECQGQRMTGPVHYALLLFALNVWDATHTGGRQEECTAFGQGFGHAGYDPASTTYLATAIEEGIALASDLPQLPAHGCIGYNGGSALLRFGGPIRFLGGGRKVKGSAVSFAQNVAEKAKSVPVYLDPVNAILSAAPPSHPSGFLYVLETLWDDLKKIV